MNVVDLFSGIGGFSLGLERAGMHTVAFCEIDPYCRRVLARRWPGVPCYDDVRELTAERLRADGIAADLLCGGFPCQDISSAGNRAGLAGARSGLWREYGRLVGELRPRFVIVENVGALLVRGLGTVLGDLAALGYDAWWDCIPAAAVGAPHRRDRVWIVAYPGGVEHQGLGDAIRRSVAAELALAAADDDDGRPEYESDSRGQSDRQGPLALADAARLQPGRQKQRPERERVGAGGESLALAHAEHEGELQPQRAFGDERRWAGDRGAAVADADVAGLEERFAWPQAKFAPAVGRRWWRAEPDVGRVAHGVPARVDRLRCLGNAVVPQIPEILGRAIMSCMKGAA